MGVNLFDLQRDRICVPVGCAFSIYLQIARILHATDFVHPTGSAPQALSTPYRGAGQSPTACARPLRSRSSISPPQPWGATGERTDLNRGESHAPIRSRSTVSDGGGDTTLGGQPSGDIANVSQPPPPESAPLTGRHHDVENDIECANAYLRLVKTLSRRSADSFDSRPSNGD